MVPFLKQHLTNAEGRYNKALCKTHSHIECTLGILQNWFGAILKKLRVHGPDYSSKIIVGCLVLHNICVENRDNFDLLPNGRHLDVSEPSDDNSTATGKAKREHIVRTYFSWITLFLFGLRWP